MRAFVQYGLRPAPAPAPAGAPGGDLRPPVGARVQDDPEVGSPAGRLGIPARGEGSHDGRPDPPHGDRILGLPDVLEGERVIGGEVRAAVVVDVRLHAGAAREKRAARERQRGEKKGVPLQSCTSNGVTCKSLAEFTCFRRGTAALCPATHHGMTGPKALRLTAPRPGATFRALSDPRGAVAQLGERLNGIQEVDGSIPFSSTTLAGPSPRPVGTA